MLNPQCLLCLVEEKDLHLRLVFSPCLCAYLRPLESPQEEEMATRSVDTDTVVLSRLPIWWILHISSCCAELVTFSAREERHRPLAGLMPRPWRRPGRGRGSFSRQRLDDRPALRDQLWPACKGDLTTWPPDQARTLLAEHLSRLLLKREGFWGKPVGFYLIHRKRQVGSERSQTFRTLRLELETWDLSTFQSKSLLGKVVLEPMS